MTVLRLDLSDAEIADSLASSICPIDGKDLLETGDYGDIDGDVHWYPRFDCAGDPSHTYQSDDGAPAADMDLADIHESALEWRARESVRTMVRVGWTHLVERWPRQADAA